MLTAVPELFSFQTELEAAHSQRARLRQRPARPWGVSRRSSGQLNSFFASKSPHDLLYGCRGSWHRITNPHLDGKRVVFECRQRLTQRSSPSPSPCPSDRQERTDFLAVSSPLALIEAADRLWVGSCFQERQKQEFLPQPPGMDSRRS